jgi:radical SAM superfamily enzyme YgiQ (UPF0313 family)
LTNIVCLITAAVSTDFEDPADAASRQVREAARNPKLGVLSLAAVLEQIGTTPIVFNLDSAYHEYLAAGTSVGLEAFPGWVAGRITSCGAALFGFSSICSSYPLTLRIARAVKSIAPDCTILLGGPQASVVDIATLSAFPFVDFILRGEADLTLPRFLEQWSGNRRFEHVPGLTYRTSFGPQRTPDAPVVDNLDDLPLPAYHLTDDLTGAHFASLELGRGCPFSCTFCSTNDFFRRKFRVKSPQRMLADMRSIAATYGIREFDLVHDMFTVDRRRVVAFCQAMIESGEGFRWACSARTDCVDEELLELMARAGCHGIFFGVEAGSVRMQKVIDKGLDPVQSKSAIAIAGQLGIGTTVSLITGFPEEAETDLRDTVDMYMFSLRHLSSSPQLNILAPLAGTPIHSRHKDEMVLEELCSDASHQGRIQNAADRDLIRNYPDIFPNFYLLPTPELDRSRLLELREFLLMATERVRWLLLALHQQVGLLDVFDSWREFRQVLHPNLRGWSIRHYYMREESRNDFIQFVESLANSSSTAVRAMVSYHRALVNADSRKSDRPAAEPLSGRISGTQIPIRAPKVHVLELDWDIQKVIEALKRDEAPVTPPRRKSYRTEENSMGARCLIEITSLVARALALCDGRRTVRQFSARMALQFDCSPRLRRYAAECLLESLRDEGLIEIFSAQARETSCRTEVSVRAGLPPMPSHDLLPPKIHVGL